jgi:HIP---CoA ligase
MCSSAVLPEIPTIPHMLALAVRRYGDRTAVEDAGQRLSYAELHRQSLLVARALLTLGIEPGDRVAIWAPNRYEWIVAAVGIYSVGAILVPVSTRLKGVEAADILEQSGARVLFSIGEFLGSYFPDLLATHPLATLERTVILGPARAGALDWPVFLALAQQTPPAAVERRLAALDGDSTSDLMFTSGTTGRPKGVMCAHGQNLRAFEYWSGVLGMRESDRYLIVNPFFHTAGYKAGWLAAMIRGATILPEAVFNAESMLGRIAQDKVSFLLGAPTLFIAMLSVPRLAEYDLSSLRVAVTGAATVPPALILRMRAELGFKTVVTAYGLTEACGFATICDPGDDMQTIAHTCGKAIPGVQVRCVDASGRDVPAGAPGEVLIRGYNVMQGYFNNEAATREAIDEAGWLHSGDVGVLDARGYLSITDRLKDMYIVGGFNCYPAEIEHLATAHPAIAQIAVVGVPDASMGEVGKAFVIVRPGATLDAAQFLAWCRQNMANYKVPRHVEFVTALPTNASGKVLKRELQARPPV